MVGFDLDPSNMERSHADPSFAWTRCAKRGAKCTGKSSRRVGRRTARARLMHRCRYATNFTDTFHTLSAISSNITDQPSSCPSHASCRSNDGGFAAKPTLSAAYPPSLSLGSWGHPGGWGKLISRNAKFSQTTPDHNRQSMDFDQWQHAIRALQFCRLPFVRHP